MTEARTCDLCGHEMADTGDCLNSECVQSARLLERDAIIGGTFHVDGSGTWRTADGGYAGVMRVLKVDQEWTEKLMQFAVHGLS